MRNEEQLIGKKFNRWTIMAFDHIGCSRSAFYLCRCDCGTIRTVNLAQLKNGHSKSCGCLRRDSATVHGGTGGYKGHKPRLYKIWSGIKDRCKCSTNKDYKNYGGRGILVCDSWLSFDAFRNWALQNGYRDNLTIDRIDVNGNYCPENCRWATLKEQSRNRRTSQMITFGGKTQCATAWCEELHMNRNLVSQRLKAGWSIERALLTPTQIKQKNKGENNG